MKKYISIRIINFGAGMALAGYLQDEESHMTRCPAGIARWYGVALGTA